MRVATQVCVVDFATNHENGGEQGQQKLPLGFVEIAYSLQQTGYNPLEAIHRCGEYESLLPQSTRWIAFLQAPPDPEKLSGVLYDITVQKA
ncbi:MAG: hypothetical protein EBE86_003490 [Hormoscilla sp. GUM202]|nr:hypothetical protein [Hormoscilla sp. GUM202]